MTMKNLKLGLFLLGIIVLVIVFLFRLNTPEDTWRCENGVWVKHGNPASSEPLSGCGVSEPETPMVNTNPVYSVTEVALKNHLLTFALPSSYSISIEPHRNLTTGSLYAVNFTFQNYHNNPNEVPNPYQLYGIYQWDVVPTEVSEFMVADFGITPDSRKEFEIKGFPAVSGYNSGDRVRFNVNLLIDGYILKLAASGNEASKITQNILDKIEVLPLKESNRL